VTVSTLFGKMPWSRREVSEQEAEQILSGFTSGLAEKIIDSDQIGK
jgi:hypothetical protein